MVEKLELAAYEVYEFKIRCSTQIAGKVTAIIAKLAAAVPGADSKTVIVALRAQASIANKLTSVVEISKRELKLLGTKVYQYTALSSELINIARTKPKTDELESDASDDAFQSRNPTKERDVPLLTVYMSCHAINELRSRYGEQTN